MRNDKKCKLYIFNLIKYKWQQGFFLLPEEENYNIFVQYTGFTYQNDLNPSSYYVIHGCKSLCVCVCLSLALSLSLSLSFSFSLSLSRFFMFLIAISPSFSLFFILACNSFFHLLYILTQSLSLVNFFFFVVVLHFGGFSHKFHPS